MKKYLIYYFFSFLSLLITSPIYGQVQNGDFSLGGACPTVPPLCPLVIQNGCLTDWERAFGTPSYVTGANPFVYLNGNGPGGEGLFQGFQFDPERSYRVCIDAQLAIGTTSSLNVAATTGLTEVVPYTAPTCFEALPGVPMELILTENVTNAAWTRYTSAEFTPNQAFDQLLIYNLIAPNASTVNIDNVTILEGCPISRVFDMGFTLIAGLYEYQQFIVAGGTPMVTSNPADQVDLRAGDFIDLVFDFEAQPTANGHLDLRIQACNGPAACPPGKTNNIASTIPMQMDGVEPVLSLDLYPNPTVSNTTITLELMYEEVGSLILYDLTGNPIREYFSGRRLEAGVQTIEVDLSGFSSGIYVMEFNVGSHTYQRKISIIR